MAITQWPYVRNVLKGPSFLRWIAHVGPVTNAATFAEFLRWPDRETVILCELTPSLTLANFTAVGGGAPNTFQVSMPRKVLTSSFKGGIYRRTVGVRENGTDLTAQTSLAAVDAAASSWYWDEAAELLYVHSSSAANPDTFTAYQAFVTFYVASKGIVLNRTDGDGSTGLYYHPWLSADAQQVLSLFVDDIVSGAKITATGDVSLLNGHGFWNTIVAVDGPYNWKNKRVQFLIGGSYNGRTLLRSQYQTHITMQVEDIGVDEYRCSMNLKPLARATEIQLPVTPYLDTDYANMGDGVRGQRKRIGYGRAIVAPELTDTTVSQGRYTIADAAYQTLFAVNQVWAVNKSTGVRTLLTLATDYTVDLTACTVTVVNATYAYAGVTLQVDVSGKPNGAGSYLKYFGEITKDLLKTFLGAKDADLDLAAFSQADADSPWELAVWLEDQRTLASILATTEANQPSLERSVMGTIEQTLAGLWTCRIWDPGYDASTIVTLRKEDVSRFEPLPKLETIYSTVGVQYGRNTARDEWLVEESTDARTLYLTESRDRLDVYTYLRTASNAQVLAQRLQAICGGLTIEAEFEERGALLAQQKQGDKVLVTFSPAPTAAGLYDSEPFELLRLDKVSPTFRMSGRLGNLKGVGKFVGRWMSSTAPDWAAATAAERSVSGFWSDAAGLADPADASSRNLSRWW